MPILGLLVLLTSVLAPDLSTEELIGRLGSSDRAVREEAARTIEERGPDALPALRAARDAARSPEARGRLAGLIARAEVRLLERPTMVALDLDDRPLDEAIEALATRSGFSLALDDPWLSGRRVTARAPRPLPFWEALDRLGRAGHIRHDPGPRWNAIGRDPQAAAIRLVDGGPSALTTYSGPLRIHLFATHRHRDISFGPRAEPPARTSVTTVTVEVQAFAEPGRFIDPAGAPRLVAVDDHGGALAPHPGGGNWPSPAERSWLIPGRLSMLHWHVPLAVPDLPGGTRLKLRGVLPLVISARRPGPLIIPLAGAAGKTFQQEGSVVRVHSISASRPQNASLMLVLSEDAGESDRAGAATGPQPDRVTELLRNRLEFEDAEGHPLNWLLPGRPQADTSGGLLIQVFLSSAAPAARLKVYRLDRLATEIPFAFDDAPAP